MSTHRARTASNIDPATMPKEVRDAIAEEAKQGPRKPNRGTYGSSNWSNGYPDAIKKAMAAMDAEEAKKAEQATCKNDTTAKEQEH